MELTPLQWYLVTVASVIAVIAAWASFAYEAQGYKDRIQHFGQVFFESVVSTAAYWALIFVLALVAAGALWLIILLLIWVPSDFFHYYFDADVFARALQNIRPLIYRSAGSPGITAIPLLDYLSLYAAYIFGPLCGIWSILGKYHQEKHQASSSES
ncbi:MAG: hypothetical protein PVF34_02115 [Gammaproteobacteria bacterium]|jgi:small-conductance mechanosensitive channel